MAAFIVFVVFQAVRHRGCVRFCVFELIIGVVREVGVVGDPAPVGGERVIDVIGVSAAAGDAVAEVKRFGDLAGR